MGEHLLGFAGAGERRASAAMQRHEMEEMFGRRAALYDETIPFFRRAAECTVDVMRGRLNGANVRILVDVATGRGAAVHPILRSLGGPRVVCADISAGMLRAARADLAQDGVHFVQCDAEAFPVRSSCADAVTCSMSLRFLRAPGRALEEMHRVLKDRGAIGVSEMGRADPKWTFFADLLRRSMSPSQRSKAFALRAFPEPISELLSEAGFVDVQLVESELVFQFADEREWWDWVESHQQGHLVRQLGSGAGAFKSAALEIVAGFETIELRQAIRVATALCHKDCR